MRFPSCVLPGRGVRALAFGPWPSHRRRYAGERSAQFCAAVPRGASLACGTNRKDGETVVDNSIAVAANGRTASAPSQEAILSIVREVLSRPDIGPDDDVFDHGA